jgi:hypothetical protein
MATKSISKDFLKELYEKDYYRWVNENLQLLKQKAVENIEKAWKWVVIDLVYWFQKHENEELAKKFFGRLSTEKRFSRKLPIYIQADF